MSSRSLYDLEQAAPSWHDRLITALRQNGFKEHTSEPCVLCLIYSTTSKVKSIVVVHVDMIVAGNDNDADWLREVSTKAFPENNLGPLTWCTG